MNRAASTFYHYRNTCRILGEFLEERYHVSDMPVKQLDENFIEAFDMYMRTTRRFMP
ncbi:phage integrase SAM-like domain-containing protein, partial [Bacteroides acidifaciens]